jgi:hypothetical protein
MMTTSQTQTDYLRDHLKTNGRFQPKLHSMKDGWPVAALLSTVGGYDRILRILSRGRTRQSIVCSAHHCAASLIVPTIHKDNDLRVNLVAFVCFWQGIGGRYIPTWL